jgi:hypothetical protein
MRKIVGRLINSIKLNQAISDAPNEINTHESTEDFSTEVFYQRMMERDIYIHISEVSVAMVGVCLTGVSIMQVGQDIDQTSNYIDDILAIDSFIFLTSFILAYWLIRVTMKGNRHIRKVSNFTNVVFLIGMVLMVIVSGLIVAQGDYFSNLELLLPIGSISQILISQFSI